MKTKWFLDPSEKTAYENRYPEEVDFTVWDSRNKIVGGGIDSEWTGHYSLKDMVQKAKSLLNSYKHEGAVRVSVYDRRYGNTLLAVTH